MKTQTRYCLFLLCLPLFLRLPLLGYPPCTDEGCYLAFSYFTYLKYTQNLCLFEGTLNVYSLLVSWIFALPGESYLWARLIDALVASMAAFVLFRTLSLFFTQKAAFGSSAAIVLAMNHPSFIQAGFKNSVFLASIALLGSIFYLESPKKGALTKAGVCLALAVLLREAFFPYIAVLGIYVWYQKGIKGLAQYGLACGFCALGILFLLCLERGGWSALLALRETYVDISRFLGARENSILENTVIFFRIILFLCLFIFAGLLYPLWVRGKKEPQGYFRVYWLGLGLALVPFAECLSKASFPYHYSQTLFGFSFLLPLGAMVLSASLAKMPNPRMRRAWLIAILLLGMAATSYYARQYYLYAKDAWYFFPTTVLGKADRIKDSFYLHTAQKIKALTKPEDRILVSSFTLGLYPLSLRVPPSHKRIMDFSTYSVAREKNLGKETPYMPKDSPSLLVETKRADFADKALHELFDHFEENYRLVFSIPAGKRHYPAFGAEIYKRK